MFPVDAPDVKDTDLTSASEQLLSSLESRPSGTDWFELSQTSKVRDDFKQQYPENSPF